MTAKAQTRELARFVDLGVAGVIAKPFDPLTLAEDLRKIVGNNLRKGHER
jgi:CheY-like chemotaxis protein